MALPRSPVDAGAPAVNIAALEASRLRACALGRRFATDDLDEVLLAGAVAYARTYAGAFPFMVMMRRVSRRGLSQAQAIGVLNCLRADVLHSEPRRQVDVAGVPDGCYAVENLGGGISFFRFSRATAGSRVGWVIVEQMAGDDARPRGHQRPGGSYRGLLAELVAAVAADPLAAAVRYGHERRICGVCGHQLTATESRGRGIGPVCGARLAVATACRLDEGSGLAIGVRMGRQSADTGS